MNQIKKLEGSRLPEQDTDYVNYFDKYFSHYKDIYEKYKRYGEVVLDVDLTDSESDERKLIIQASNLGKLEDTLRNYWQNTYAHIISNCNDIEKAVLNGAIGCKIRLSNYNIVKFVRNYRFEVSDNFLIALINHCNSCKKYLISDKKGSFQSVEMDIMTDSMLCRIEVSFCDRMPEKINSYIKILSAIHISEIYKD